MLTVVSFPPSYVSTAIEIGFTQRRIFHIEEFRTFDTLINKSRASEQTFTAQVEISTLNSPFGQSATRGEDFQTGLPGLSTVLVRLRPSEPNVTFSYRIIGDNSPEKPRGIPAVYHSSHWQPYLYLYSS